MQKSSQRLIPNAPLQVSHRKRAMHPQVECLPMHRLLDAPCLELAFAMTFALNALRKTFCTTRDLLRATRDAFRAALAGPRMIWRTAMAHGGAAGRPPRGCPLHRMVGCARAYGELIGLRVANACPCGRKQKTRCPSAPRDPARTRAARSGRDPGYYRVAAPPRHRGGTKYWSP